MDKKKLAKFFKAFGDENRLKILDLIKDEEKCACNILEELHISQSTLSHHMKVLEESEIVVSRKEGKWTHYSIDPRGVERLVQVLNKLNSKK
ncbi:MAG: metalloregulator ArsR/SmtB family transcription factor [Fusobacterium sp. JB021]|nr:metalloregulator ArsR/SmtB family transcription factor [Fusobacterium sp. JB020]MDP0493039.1 metalloregulator ArsR/SmtB family transcription factor [Fusobacterium sp. JB021]MDP0505790.1 metalloregulator ArsR/SmtB family transcription factor [Fusobacterium sp. JB019]